MKYGQSSDYHATFTRKIMTLRLALHSFAASVLLAACQRPLHTHGPDIGPYFQPVRPGDTLHLEIEGDSVTGTIIPNALFFQTVPPALLQEIDYLADSSQAVVFGSQYFPHDDSLTAYWVKIEQHWFQHHSLLLYNQRKKVFTDRITVAEWYGGEGGQVLTGSWLFDFDGDGKKDLVRREIERGFVPGGEEPQEYSRESVSLLLWKNGQFKETPVPDTAAIIRRFPIRSYWE